MYPLKGDIEECIGLYRVYGDSQNWRYLFAGPYSKGNHIFGSMLGSPYLGKLLFGFRS